MRMAIETFSDTDVVALVCDNSELSGTEISTSLSPTHHLSSYLVDTFAVPVIVGPGFSLQSVDMYNQISEDDVLMISPSAGGDALSYIDGGVKSDDAPGRFWRTVSAEYHQAETMVSFFTDSQEYENIVVVQDYSSDDLEDELDIPVG